jgi:serine/threonine-protein phosphatase 5
VCGDLHGQFFDLLYILDVNGVPSENNLYLFNGDFVDRGPNSVEVIISLFALQLAAPEFV